MEETIEKKAFEDAVWNGKYVELFPSSRIQVVGAGGTGSWTALFLSRMGCPFIIYDGDVVEQRNLSGQFYNKEDVGKFKASAVMNNCERFSENLLNSRGVTMNYSSSTVSSYIVFSCVDNFTARKIIFSSWKNLMKFNSSTPYFKGGLFIDMRLELELLQVYAVTVDKIEDYEKTLKNDEDIPSAPCTLKQTTHNAAMIAGIAINQFNNYISNLVTKDNMRTVDFFTEYFSPLNSFNYG